MKRMTDTKLGREPWFRKLAPKLKCAVRFLFDECDNAGVWVIDMDALTFYVNEEVLEQELFAAMNSDKIRIEKFLDNKIFISGFCDFQYGALTETCKPHRPIIQLLKKYGLFERVTKGYGKGIQHFAENSERVQEKEQEKEIEKEKEEGGMGETKFPTFPKEDDIELALPEIKLNSAIQLMKITKGQDVDDSQITGLWRIFKVQNFTGKKYYADVGDVYSHFINWIKTQNLTDGKRANKERHKSHREAQQDGMQYGLDLIKQIAGSQSGSG